MLLTTIALASLSLPARAADNPDPLEGLNRKSFAVNEAVDEWLLEPVARGWDYIAHEKVQECVANFFYNIRFPVVMINNLLQGKPVHAAQDLGRFAINTVSGLGGFFDPASKVGLVRHDEDFGQTLGVWGIGPGAYLMIPGIGPLSVRDGVGYLVDWPLAIYPIFLGFEYTFPARVIDTVNWRAQNLEIIANSKEASYDYYVFVRNAYLQRREALINDTEDTAEDLYYSDEEEQNAPEDE
ncbi:MAG TPA: VacJ family lipoprotein [Terriglobales bacterium]|nr:VacJ family lipoprotein [Terriglobales bacterium]